MNNVGDNVLTIIMSYTQPYKCLHIIRSKVEVYVVK